MRLITVHDQAHVVPRIDRLAEIDGLGGALLSNDAPLQTRRSNSARTRDPEVLCFDTIEHRGRLWATRHAGVLHHLRFSSGSNNELQTQIELSKRVQIVGGEEVAILIADAEEIGRMLHGLIGSLDRVR